MMMTTHEDLTLADGRTASLTRNQDWTTNATKRHVAGDLLVVVDNQTGSQIEAVIYNEEGRQKVGALKRIILWQGTENPALDATSSDGFEIVEIRFKQAEELLAIYGLFKH
jgi:hypothetical protein